MTDHRRDPVLGTLALDAHAIGRSTGQDPARGDGSDVEIEAVALANAAREIAARHGIQPSWLLGLAAARRLGYRRSRRP